MVSGSCIYPVYCHQELIPLHKLFMGIRRAWEASFVWGGMGSREAAGNFLAWVLSGGALGICGSEGWITAPRSPGTEAVGLLACHCHWGRALRGHREAKSSSPASKGAAFCADRAFRGDLRCCWNSCSPSARKRGWMATGERRGWEKSSTGVPCV